MRRRDVLKLSAGAAMLAAPHIATGATRTNAQIRSARPTLRCSIRSGAETS